jgi:hypothetical protein
MVVCAANVAREVLMSVEFEAIVPNAVAMLE